MMSKQGNSQHHTYIIDIHNETELARLQLQDNVFNEIIDLLPRQYIPREGDRILDIACGHGGWALQVARAYPGISVVGMDISEEMIKYARAQANAQELSAQFSIMDMFQSWHFPDHHFDLVNARFISGLTPNARWESLLRECWRVLRPGGIIRHTDSAHVSTPTSPSIEKFTMMTYAAIHKTGQSFSPYELTTSAVVEQLLKKTGFDYIALVPYVVDISHGTPMNQPMRENLSMSEKLLKPFMLQMQMISPEEFDKLLEGCASDWENTSFCGHWYVGSVSGVKAKSGESTSAS